ncbi:hypothetical protein [Bacteroides cellulosilyticus]|uniref:hypothetical protein n=1 Tax=Bacteroides cellulosilyticus TaxID=246787 RepID=UPI00321B6A5B
MATNEVTATKCKSKHSFLFVGLIALCILIQVIIYITLGSTELEGVNIFQLIILSVINPITALVCTLVATIMYII